MDNNNNKAALNERIRSSKYSDIMVIALTVAAAMFVMWTFTGRWPWTDNPYNSYILQAQSWLQGRLDLGRDYKWLELAIYNNKYYVSFPPLPSIIMLPFVALHWTTCDGFIALASAIFGAVYAYKTADALNIKRERAIMLAMLVTIGSNWFFIAQSAWVWFIAQNLAFTFSTAAIYYAVKNKAGLSLAFWACAVGCRPLQFLYLPVLLYIICKNYAETAKKASLADFAKTKWSCVIPMAVIALVYMALNFARFGNPLEFGHNYLPEFQRVSTGQFHYSYIAENIKKLFRLPEVSFKEAWEYQSIDGFLIFLSSPIFLTYLIYAIRSFFKDRDRNDKILTVLIFAMVLLELIMTSAHKTMGGQQFGNRYPIDVLPLAYLGIVSVMHDKGEWEKLNYVLLAFGFAMNLLGSTHVFIK